MSRIPTFTRRQAAMFGMASFVALQAGPRSAAAATWPLVTIYRNPNCRCCEVWADRLRSAGFSAIIKQRRDLAKLKAAWSVPRDLTSCHTAAVSTYIVEGHVPPADIKRLLARRPEGLGLAVPGMPMNSPGMEVEGAPDEPFTVWLFRKDGTRTAFAKYPELRI